MGVAGTDNLDHANESGVNGSLSVGTSAVQVKVGASPLKNRKMVTLNPQDNGIFFGFSSGVTTANGTEMFKDELISLPVGPDIELYVIADSASKSVRITELA